MTGTTVGLATVSLFVFLALILYFRRLRTKVNSQEHNYFEKIIENVTDVITILELNGNQRFVSGSVKSVLGYEQSEITGTNVFDYIHPEDISRVRDTIAKNIIKPNAVDHTELRFRHKDGSWRVLESWGKNLLFDPRVGGLVICSRDVTHQRSAEEKMILQSHALNAAANGIVITDKDGIMVWVNEAVCRLTGYAFEEIIGKTPRIFKSGEQDSDFYRTLWTTVSAGQVWIGELINRRKDGRHYYEKMIITPVRNSADEITHFIAIKEDISAQKQLETQFRQAQKMEVLGRLAGGVAHDFNNLLTVILGYSDLLSKQLQAPQQREAVEEIRMAGERASRLTAQLLAFSRKQIFQFKIADLNAVVEGAEKMIKRLVPEDVQIKLELGAGLKPVKVDVGQIEQVIMNLVVNARDAMPTGGRILIQTKNISESDSKSITDLGWAKGEYVLFTVQDNGMGMTAETKAHLFEPFFTTKESGKGTGLGLSTIYGIVKQLRGYIYADSELGKGTTFRVYIPVCRDKGTNVDNKAKERLAVGSETILIAEDDDMVRSITEQTLKQQGYVVLEAVSGKEALDLAMQTGKGKINLLIADMVMPQMGGNELAFNYTAWDSSVRILFISGFTDQNSVQRWLEKGYSFLQKPFSPAELLHKVREVLDKK